MYQFEEKIQKFLKENFVPSNLEESTHSYTNETLLEYLFSVFPKDCITDFQLYDIMSNLGYEKIFSTDGNSLHWCLKYKPKS